MQLSHFIANLRMCKVIMLDIGAYVSENREHDSHSTVSLLHTMRAHYGAQGRKIMSTPELDDRIKAAAAALSGKDYGQVIGRCKSDLLVRERLSRQDRNTLSAAFDRLLVAFANVTGRVVNLVSLIRTAMKDTIDLLRLKFEFCGVLEGCAAMV